MVRIKATIWNNETQNGPRHNMNIRRLCKGDDVWKDSTSFGRKDLFQNSRFPRPPHAAFGGVGRAG